MREYKPIPKHLHEKLMRIVPSENYGLKYYPCRVTLKDGGHIDRVYVVEQEQYIKVWGIYPTDDTGKSEILIEDVVDIEESHSRLPAKFANKLYEAGESGMGYTVFTVLFRHGGRQAFMTGNAVDFISFPEGKTMADIRDVRPHKGRSAEDIKKAPAYYWCIYSGIDTNLTS
jgi:hypothetical protein